MNTNDLSTDIQIHRIEYKTLANRAVEIIYRAIMEGTYLPGSQLPPEKELINLLGVSRTTLREALRTLEEQGAIIRRRGYGTFVNAQPIIKDLNRNFGISEMISMAGFVVGTRSVELRMEIPSPTITQALCLSDNDQIYVFDRVRTANDQPVVWSIDFIPVKVCKNKLQEGPAQLNESIYDFFAKTLGIYITQGTATIRPVLSDSKSGKCLEIKTNTPLLEITQIDFDNHANPVLYSVEYHISDKFKFLIQRRGPNW